MFKIIDWAGNELFIPKQWESFEEAEDFLSDFLDEDYEEDRGEYYIVENGTLCAN